jgi:hypothetical protein
MKEKKERKIILTVMKSSPSYPTREFKPFIETLRNSGYDGELVIFSNSLSKKTEKYFKSRNAKIIPYSFKYPYLENNKTIPRLFKRFKDEKINIFHFRELLPYIYLLDNKDNYDTVIIADTADVIFQKNPFKENFDRKKVYLSLQDNKIKESKNDSLWIEQIYGKKELEKIWDNNICCTGIILGGIKPVLGFLDPFVNEFKGDTIEQGNINYLIYNNKIKNYVITNNQEGFLMTCSGGKLKNYTIGKDKRLRSKSGKILSIIHQYDTFPRLSFINRGICWRSIRETIKRIPFFGKLFVRLRGIFVKSYVHLDRYDKDLVKKE